MYIAKKNLRALFLKRLKTQERSYPDLNLCYTPRLYIQLVRQHKELKQLLNSVFTHLIDNIELELVTGEILKLPQIEGLEIEYPHVFAQLEGAVKLQLADFILTNSAASHITLDHYPSFYELMAANTEVLPHLRALTNTICQGNSLSKEQLRKEYSRVREELQFLNIKSIIQEVGLLADKTQMKLMVREKNFSKGKKVMTKPKSVTPLL